MKSMLSSGVHPHEASVSENRTSAEQAAFDMGKGYVSSNVSFHHSLNVDHIVHL